MLSNNKPHHLYILEFNKDIDKKRIFRVCGVEWWFPLLQIVPLFDLLPPFWGHQSIINDEFYLSICFINAIDKNSAKKCVNFRLIIKSTLTMDSISRIKTLFNQFTHFWDHQSIYNKKYYHLVGFIIYICD